MQGVVASFDPTTGEGTILCDADRSVYVLAGDALDASIFRNLRQGQRVVFDLNGRSQATSIRTGAEGDMGLSSNIVI
ncbi:MAG: cold-shock protein [Acidimicrobiia bacterium]